MEDKLYALEDAVNKMLDTDFNKYYRHGKVEFECLYKDYAKFYIEGKHALSHLDRIKEAVVKIFSDFGFTVDFEDVDYDVGCCEYFTEECALPVYFK